MHEPAFEIKIATEPRYAHVHDLIIANPGIVSLSEILPLLDGDFLEGVIGTSDLTDHGYYESTLTCADCDEPFELDTKYVLYQNKPYCADCWKPIHEDLLAEEETND